MPLNTKIALTGLFCLSSALSAETFWDVSTEYITSSDVDVFSAWTAANVTTTENIDTNFRFGNVSHQMNYAPNESIDPFGLKTSLKDEQWNAQARATLITAKSEFSVAFSIYEGFRNYSSLWINEYYRQQYGSGGIPGVAYTTPDPHGFGVYASWRREMIPAVGFLSFSFGFLRDSVAPGYEIEDLGTSFSLTKSRDVLDTFTGSIEWEGVINASMRTKQNLNITVTTDRDPRVSWNGDLNISLSQRWISRSSFSFAHEEPDFTAGSVSQTFEFEATPNVFLLLSGRYYEDTGQIEVANLVSSAAPRLKTASTSFGFRVQAMDGRLAFSLSTGPYHTNYAETGIGTERFTNLYQDRHWWWSKASLRYLF